MNSKEAVQAAREDFERGALEVISTLESKKNSLSAALAEIEAQITAMRGAIATVNSTKKVTTKYAKKQKKQVPWSELKLSVERRRLMHAFLMDNDAEITTQSVRAAFPGWSDAALNIAFKEFRSEGLITLLDRKGNHNSNIYHSNVRSQNDGNGYSVNVTGGVPTNVQRISVPT